MSKTLLDIINKRMKRLAESEDATTRLNITAEDEDEQKKIVAALKKEGIKCKCEGDDIIVDVPKDQAKDIAETIDKVCPDAKCEEIDPGKVEEEDDDEKKDVNEARRRKNEEDDEDKVDEEDDDEVNEEDDEKVDEEDDEDKVDEEDDDEKVEESYFARRLREAKKARKESEDEIEEEDDDEKVDEEDDEDKVDEEDDDEKKDVNEARRKKNETDDVDIDEEDDEKVDEEDDDCDGKCDEEEDEIDEEDDEEVKKDVHEAIRRDIRAIAKTLKLDENALGQVETAFIAAVETRAKGFAKRIAEHQMRKDRKALRKDINKMNENVNKYLTYVAKEWVNKNKVAINDKLKVRLAENIINNIKSTLQENNIAVPESKTVIRKYANKIEKLERDLNEARRAVIDKTEALNHIQAAVIISHVADENGLTDSQRSKLFKMSESSIDFSYDTRSAYKEHVEMLAEMLQNDNNISTKKAKVLKEDTSASNNRMNKYVQFLGQTRFE